MLFFYLFVRICGSMELTPYVASIFHIAFYANRGVRIAKRTPVPSIDYQRVDWNRLIGGPMAMVS